MPYNLNNGSFYNWNNPYTPYTQQSYSPMPQQSFAQPQQPQMTQGIIWVDGEVGAKAFQMPANWPAGAPIPLWDTNEQVIYLKSMNQMGMPNPLQKARYTLDELPNQQFLPTTTSGQAQPTVNYVTKEDLDQMKNEIRTWLNNEMNRPNQGGRNQNGSNNAERNGGNR